MHIGCRADLRLKNLELAKADELAKTCETILLQKLENRDDVERQPRTVCSTSGMEVAIEGTIISTLDRIRALETLELVFVLSRHRTTSFKMENFCNARQCLEKAYAVSKELCGVASLVHHHQKLVLFQKDELRAQPVW